MDSDLLPSEQSDLNEEQPVLPINSRQGIRHVPNLLEFKRIFNELANKHFEEMAAANKLTVLKQAQIDEIIHTLKNWDNIDMHFTKKSSLQFKWRKRYFIIIYYS